MSSSFMRCILIAIALLAFGTRAEAQLNLSSKEALELAFPKAKFERKSLILSKDQRKEVTKLAGRKPSSSRFRPYRAIQDKKVLGTVYFDTRKVRSKAQTLMIVVDPDGKIARIEVLRFDEPREYLAPAIWMGQLKGKSLSDSLKIKGDLTNVTGATLTAHANVHAVREVLAAHHVLFPDDRTVTEKKVTEKAKEKPE